MKPGAFKLWVINWILNLYSPHRVHVDDVFPLHVAVQVKFARKKLRNCREKPGFHFIIGSRVETRRSRALWVN